MFFPWLWNGLHWQWVRYNNANEMYDKAKAGLSSWKVTWGKIGRKLCCDDDLRMPVIGLPLSFLLWHRGKHSWDWKAKMEMSVNAVMGIWKEQNEYCLVTLVFPSAWYFFCDPYFAMTLWGRGGWVYFSKVWGPLFQWSVLLLVDLNWSLVILKKWNSD